MKPKDSLNFVWNDRIKFVTMSSPDSQFATLDRLIVITGPAELIELAGKADIRVLDQLVSLLRDPDRAWAAIVLLAALTRREEKVVDAFANRIIEYSLSKGDRICR